MPTNNGSVACLAKRQGKLLTELESVNLELKEACRGEGVNIEDDPHPMILRTQNLMKNLIRQEEEVAEGGAYYELAKYLLETYRENRFYKMEELAQETLEVFEDAYNYSPENPKDRYDNYSDFFDACVAVDVAPGIIKGRLDSFLNSSIIENTAMRLSITEGAVETLRKSNLRNGELHAKVLLGTYMYYTENQDSSGAIGADGAVYTIKKDKTFPPPSQYLRKELGYNVTDRQWNTTRKKAISSLAKILFFGRFTTDRFSIDAYFAGQQQKKIKKDKKIYTNLVNNKQTAEFQQ
jgi:hypothetical protein